jgi:hypothetical protein
MPKFQARCQFLSISSCYRGRINFHIISLAEHRALSLHLTVWWCVCGESPTISPDFCDFSSPPTSATFYCRSPGSRSYISKCSSLSSGMTSFTVGGQELLASACQEPPKLTRPGSYAQEEDFIAYMFGFQDSQGLEDVPKAVAAIVMAEEQQSAIHRRPKPGVGSETDRRVVPAMLCRMRFRRNLLNVCLAPLPLLLPFPPSQEAHQLV